MPFAPITIPGVTGEILTTYSFWTGYKFFVEGQRVKPHGFPRNKLTFPGTNGPVEAKIKGGLFRAHPVLVVGDTEHTTGPPTPRGLQALALLPLLSIVILQGALGFVLAFGAVAASMGVIRGTGTNGAKAALMVGILLAVAATDIVVVVAVVSSTS